MKTSFKSRGLHLAVLPALFLLLVTACTDTESPVSPDRAGDLGPKRASVAPTNPGPAQPAPRIRNPFVEPTEYYGAQVQYENELAQAVMDIFQSFDPVEVTALNVDLYAALFGEAFDVNTSGLLARAAPGPFDPAAFTTVESSLGATAALTDLRVWAFDPTPDGQVIAIPVNFPYDGFDAYTFSARCGSFDPVIGYAVHLYDSDENGLVFVPAVRIPDGGPITAAQAGEFLALAANGVVGQSDFEFLAWVTGQDAGKAGGGDKKTSEDLWLDPQKSYCDIEALKECLQDVAAQYWNDLRDAKDAYSAKVNAIYREWGKDGPRTLGAALGGSTLAGGLGGAAAGGPTGPGALVTAAIGAGIGFISGGVSWLIYEAFYADGVEEDLEQAAQEYHDDLCAAAQKAAKDSQACFDEFCPELSEWWANEMALWLMQIGC